MGLNLSGDRAVGSKIHATAIIEEGAVMGSGCTVGPYCHIVLRCALQGVAQTLADAHPDDVDLREIASFIAGSQTGIAKLGA